MLAAGQTDAMTVLLNGFLKGQASVKQLTDPKQDKARQEKAAQEFVDFKKSLLDLQASLNTWSGDY